MQVGTGSRAEKIKTYNYKDTRMSGERCYPVVAAWLACMAACRMMRPPPRPA
jgi:protein subunit release factor A